MFYILDKYCFISSSSINKLIICLLGYILPILLNIVNIIFYIIIIHNY